MLQLRRRFVVAGQSYRGYVNNRCILVHVPKTAGKAVGKSLFGHYCGPHLSIHEYYDIFERRYGIRDARDWFSFAFVRNPWDRLYSAYRYLRAGGGNRGDAAFAERVVNRYADFRDFVKGWTACDRGTASIHLRTQASFVCNDDGSVEVDLVGRFEGIDRDYEAVRAKLGGVGQPLAKTNVSKIKGDYRTAYDDETATIVGRVYADDVRAFGYTFDPAPEHAADPEPKAGSDPDT